MDIIHPNISTKSVIAQVKSHPKWFIIYIVYLKKTKEMTIKSKRFSFGMKKIRIFFYKHRYIGVSLLKARAV
jgi:hypothetical protein